MVLFINHKQFFDKDEILFIKFRENQSAYLDVDEFEISLEPF